MHILAVDTATEVCGVAVAADGHVLAALAVSRGRTHTRVLMEGIRAVLDIVRLDMGMVDAFAVTQGPGSFTGLRIGISTVKGLALATQKPLVGVSTLSVLAHQAPEGTPWVCPMIDARRQQVYWSLYRRRGNDLVRVLPEQVGAPPDVAAHVDGPCLFIGNGAHLHGPMLRERLADWALWAGAETNTILPAAVVRLAWRRLQQGAQEDVHRFAPVYLRKPDARDPGAHNRGAK